MRFLKSAVKYFENYDRPDKVELRPFLNGLSDCKPFLLSDHYISCEDTIPAKSMASTLYLPFAVCSFELMRPYPAHDMIDALPRKVSASAGWINNTGFKEPRFIGQMFIEKYDLSIDRIFLLCDWVHERDIWFENLNYIPKTIAGHAYSYSSYEELNADYSAKSLLSIVNSNKNVFGETLHSFKIKRSGRLPELVSKLIVISPSKYSNRLKSIDKSPIDWKHSWRVRGHWRKINPGMLGKDRSGECTIIGRTWIKDFIKGDGPLIEKTRILKGEENVRSKQSYFSGQAR